MLLERKNAIIYGAGGIDVSFNLISRGDVQRTPLVDMTTDDLLRAVVTGLRSNFVTARAAARRMLEQGSGVILHLNSASGAAAMPGMGSTGPADAATESFMRYLAAELGPQGVRVLGIHTAGFEPATRGSAAAPPRGLLWPRARLPTGATFMSRSSATSTTAGDEAAFGELVQRHRRELHVHCYRMTGSFDEAEDLVQETFLRAWRRRDSFEGGPGFRAWLYRIATNACLDALRSSRRRVSTVQSFAEVPWLQPYPDRLLDELAPSDTQPTPWWWPARPSS